MNKITRYILICSPFIVGSIMFILGIYNLFSSILFFCGGYIATKNLFDYRKIKRNNQKSNIHQKEPKKSYQKDYSYQNPENIIGLKRTRIHKKVRIRTKY